MTIQAGHGDFDFDLVEGGSSDGMVVSRDEGSPGFLEEKSLLCHDWDEWKTLETRVKTVLMNATWSCRANVGVQDAGLFRHFVTSTSTTLANGVGTPSNIVF